MEEPEKSKPWEKPWTTDEIRRESGNWSLAGDAGLLNHLQQFSQNLLQRTHSTEVSLNKLIEELKTTSTEISNVTNSFLALANTQFVENRVYDDDENEISSEDKKKEEEKIKPKAQQEAEVVAKIKEALAKGMALLDSHFDAVDVPASDSEEEESSASTGRVFLEARNPYMMRPLPCLIGSKEFMDDDHVGLGELQSDTEESPDQNLVQSSESEEDLEQGEFGAVPKRPRLSSSSMSENSEPESDRSGTQGKQKKHKVGSSLLGSADALEEEPDMFGRESPPEADVGTVTQRGAHSSFAAELASKLGGVVAESSIAQKQERAKSDNLFSPSSEPEEDNSLFGNNAGKFSGGQGLFDDLDDWRKAPNSLWDSSEETHSRKQAEKDPQVGSNNTFSAGPRSDDLFNRSSVDQADDDDDDDIFSTGVRSSQKSASTKVIRIAPRDGLPEQNVFTSTPTEVPGPVPTKLHSQGLFDEVEKSDLFKNSDLSSKTGTPRIPKTSSLFDGTDTDDGDLFSVPSGSKKDVKIPQDVTKKKIPVGGVPVKLFQSKLSPLTQQPSADSSDDVPVESTRSLPISGDSSSGIGKTGTGTFDSSQNIATGKISLFDSKEDELFQPELTSTKKSIHEEDGSDSLFGSKSFRTPTITGAVKPPSNLGGKDRKPVSLFDDSDSGDDELFSSTSSTSSWSRRSQGSGDLLAVEKKPLQKKGLFDDENVLFGASQQDDPGFDIFSGDSGMKNNMNSVPKFVPEEKNTHSSLFDDNISGAKKVSHGLFDDFSDPSDDIFAIPARTGGIDSEKPNSSVKKALKNDLFADDVDSAVDIFQVSVPKVSNNLRASVGAPGKSSSSVHSDVTNRVSDSDVTNSSTDITSVAHIGKISKPSSLFDDLETTVEDQEKSESKTSYKPLVNQKSKSSISKPSLFESSPEESDIFSVSSKVSSNQSKTETGVERLTKSLEQSENINFLGSQQVVNNILEEKADQASHLESGTDNTSQNRSEDSLQAPATTKPEPPRTLNIRKTTDMLFNDEEDLWTTGSLDEKVNGSAVDLSVGNEKVMSSDTLSAILQDYSSDKVVDAPDGSIISVRKEPTAEEDPTKAAPATTIGSISPQKTKSLETVSSVRSPRKLFIDPTALLPGAVPPSRSVKSEGGVSFDTPVDTNAVLHSAGKGRAKIQVKRRPQSRRARQEALRVSMDLENDDTVIESKPEEEIIVRKESLQNNNFSHLEPKVQAEGKPVLPKPEVALKPALSKTSEKEAVKGKGDGISEISGPNTPPDATSKPSVSDFFNGSSNPLSPSTDEEDFFAIPQDLPAEYGETKEQTSDERKNLFGGAPIISPVGLSARPTLFGDDADTHSHHISSSDLFSEITEPSGSSKSPPLNISEPKLDLFLERKENTLQPAGTKDLFDKADNSLDDDYDLFKSSESATPKKSQNIFSSVENQLAPNEDLFGTSQSKQQIVPKTDISDKRSTNLFVSTEDELLFSSRNSKEFKNVDNTSTVARNIEGGKDRGLLFSASDSRSNDLFSVDNKSDIFEAVIPKTSVDLFPSSEPGKVSDQLDGTCASAQEQKTSLYTDDNNLFSDTNQEKNLKTNLFSSGVKNQVSKTNSDDESEASLFSNKGWSSGSRRISATQSNSLFGDDSPESDDLFASSIITSKRKISSEGLKESANAKGSLFEDNDDNIFEAKSTKSESKLTSSSVLEANEDSDLFSSSVSSKKTSVRTSKISSTVVQRQQKEEDDLFDDPLMVIKK